MAQQDNPVALSTQTEGNKYWVVDSEASDHMSGNVDLFENLNHCSNEFTVRIADGSISKMARIGTVVLSDKLSLKTVLFVPNLTCNLLSVSKLTKDLKCVTNFHSSHCEFQDLESGKMIANAKEFEGSIFLRFQVIQENKLVLQVVFLVLFFLILQINIVQ